MEEEFSVKKTKSECKKSALNKEDILIKISTLPVAKQQNINIILAKTKLSPQIICNALKLYDTSILSNSKCKMLLTILPTESELTGVKEYEDHNQLADLDKFILGLGDIPGYDLRINSIIFKDDYLNYFEEFDKKFKSVLKTIQFLMNDRRILEWLKIILAYGNYLNGTSNRY